MKKFFYSILAVAALAITSCGGDDDITSGPDTMENEISGVISTDMTLTNDRIWNLNGRTTVTSGTTLTIEPGTIIKGFAGQGANASVLIIARGAKIEANGTATQPIVFTSTADNIDLGQTTGTNLGQNDRGLWGVD
ncbi:hypothetical protein JCM19296_3 [Nonlabens ulvanivorans]|uniref:Uncharacterized protein n=1 Tax=Nonlabens ulvanivorans TaxID=906888 RepID=A0A081D679_NONUL|nr:hypothetical protein [Nonlabens ulvanivorans]GAK74425.1 hypothetical protein JCM19296_3 [Nonlabens ulvanivorans]